jgi:hypothetical protein
MEVRFYGGSQGNFPFGPFTQEAVFPDCKSPLIPWLDCSRRGKQE